MRFLPLAVVALSYVGCGGSGTGSAVPTPDWLQSAHIFVTGVGVDNTDCRTGICQHNENTDLTVWHGSTWMVHRTAESQILGDNSALHIYRSDDRGKHFTATATLPASIGRDLRDPHFYQVGDALYLKALTRLPVTSPRDSDVETIAIGKTTTDGVHWTDLPNALAPTQWSLWRIQELAGVYYSAAYHDGDSSVSLFTSTDGATFSQGADIYTVAADAPLETELVFMPSGALLAIVRTDGATVDLLGGTTNLHTHICWAEPPYSSFTCPGAIDGQRLDGPLAFLWHERLFVVARKHLGHDLRKRTALFELTGFSPGAVPAIKEWGELPSAGDTSYAGMATIDDQHILLSWYAGDLTLDENWIYGILDATNIWTAVLDYSRL